jgi:DNA invertase Pin-like site-specific DNA recombinase
LIGIGYVPAFDIMALLAQQERQLISTRTKAALAEPKVRGVKLGSPEQLAGRLS